MLKIDYTTHFWTIKQILFDTGVVFYLTYLTGRIP